MPTVRINARGAALLSFLLLACSDSPADPGRPDCLGIDCVEGIGLIMRRPEVVWERSRLSWNDGRQIAGPGDTLLIRTRVENHAPTAAPAGWVFIAPARALESVAGPGFGQDSFPPIPPGDTATIERLYAVARYTFGTSDTLRATLLLRGAHDLNGDLTEGATAVPLVANGFELEFLDLPSALQRGDSTNVTVRISNPFELPFPSSELELCQLPLPECRFSDDVIGVAPTLAPAESARISFMFRIPLAEPWDVEWYQAVRRVARVCVVDVSRGCASAPIDVIPHWGDRCTIHPLQPPATRTESFGSWCGGETAYTFTALQGATYRARITAGTGDLAFATPLGVTDDPFESWPSDRTFTAAASGVHYLVVRHEGSMTVRLDRIQ